MTAEKKKELKEEIDKTINKMVIKYKAKLESRKTKVFKSISTDIAYEDMDIKLIDIETEFEAIFI